MIKRWVIRNVHGQYWAVWYLKKYWAGLDMADLFPTRKAAAALYPGQQYVPVLVTTKLIKRGVKP